MHPFLPGAPHLPSRKHIPLATLTALAGSGRNVLLLQRILWWAPYARVQRWGHTWIIKSRAEWMTETGLSLDQHKRALAELRRRGIVETRQGLWGNPQRAICHLRLLHGCETAPPMAEQNRTTPSGAEPHHSPIHTSSSDSEALDTTGAREDAGSTPEVNMPTTADVLADFERDVAAEFSEDGLEKAIDAARSASTLRTVYRTAYGIAYPDATIQPMETRQLGELTRLCRLLGGYARAPRLLADAVLHWGEFRKAADSISTPERPHVNFMSAHAGELVDWWLARAQHATDGGAHAQSEDKIK